jgi:peroxiredoxin
VSANTQVTDNIDWQSWLKAGWFWTGLIAIVVIGGGAWILFSSSMITAANSQSGAGLEPAPVAGHPAPNFELSTPDGELVRLSDYKGQPVIVNFWATWCGPCRAEFPEFQQAAVDNADRLVIIGVNSTATDQVDNIPPFIDEFGITFPIVLDQSGDVVDQYRVLGLPTTVFIDSNGVVNEVFTGPLNKAYIESKISELQAGS